MLIFFLLTILVCSGYAALLVFYLIGWNKTSNWDDKSPILNLPALSACLPAGKTPQAVGQAGLKSSVRISIIIPARNEEKNLPVLLKDLSCQNFPEELFEIIVADDFSSDQTKAISLAQNLPNLKVVSANSPGKKNAITEGIRNASGLLVITTDADCRLGKNWLAVITSFYLRFKPKMICAPVLPQRNGNWKAEFQWLEMLALAVAGSGALYFNLPLFCSGANLAYEKETFFAVNGFEGNEHIPTGDDVFLMFKIHDKYPGSVRFLKSKEALAETASEKNLPALLNQRLRWASKSFSKGIGKSAVAALVVFFVNFFILLSGALSVINIKFVFLFVGSFIAKAIIDYMVLHSVGSFFGKKVSLLKFILLSFAYPVYAIYVGWWAPFSGYRWKGRKAKIILQTKMKRM